MAAWARVAAGSTPADSLTAAQLALIGTIADTILPRTDTPSATDVGVPAFVNVIVSENYTDTDRTAFVTGLEAIDTHMKANAADPIGSLEALAAELDAMNEKPAVAQAKRPERPTGKFTLEGLGQALGATIPEGAIVVDESVTTGRGFFPFSAGAPPHDWLNNMGGSIGYGTPVAVGAAVACPNRKVIALIGDGSAMYTFQSLWTMAREGLDVCVLIFSNRSYKILYSQLADVGAANPGPRAKDMLTLDRPAIDFAGLAKSMGVPGGRAHDLGELTKELTRRMSQRGPYLIDVVM